MENKLTAQELRIDNLVMNGLNIVPIKSIHTESFLKNKITVYVELNKNLRHYCLNIDEIEPIPLTEEWLLKFGFTKKENKQYWYKDDSMLRFALLDGCLHCSIGDDKNGVLYNRLYSVHQLQNLFYAVNNTELTIK